MKRVILLLAGLSAMGMSSSQAAIVGVETQPVSQSLLPGYTVLDVMIDFTDILRSQEMILTLSSGEVYQDPVGGSLPPNEAFLPFFPTFEFDTFVALGGATQQTSYPTVDAGLFAADIDMNSTYQFDTAGLNITWFALPGTDIPGQNDFMTARITLTNDAVGTLYYRGTTDGDDPNDVQVFELPVSGVPEPSSVLLACLAIVAVGYCRVKCVFSQPKL
ncbi:hypothetical protein NG895_17160 [Aeoliella sp. ICT_H6.2]|uniref:PEP-CTERM protein-sorting domain-containing protein n=1 Tax=Aeoliella straminimaris TaxID=2954799 RepID=A0A9X2JK03_9BACT|nr:hypothetical protein [Aeoliella straminimaris]MCO6045629.1 hypothetical protein [Aeoliella straminimaris]